jgi:DNA-binding PucR family transcriptional regulator
VGAVVGDLLGSVAASLRRNAPALSAALIDEIQKNVPELGSDAPIEDLLVLSVAANVTTVLDILEAGADVSDLEPPAAAVEYARRLAQRQVPMSALLRAYRLGQAAFEQRMIQGLAAMTNDPQIIVGASLQLSTVLFGYIDRVSEQVVIAYQAERDRWMRNRGAVRSARVASILGEGAVDIADAEQFLGYPLRQLHRGVVVWADDTVAPVDRLSRLERTMTKLAEQYQIDRSPLIVAPDESTIWGWMANPTQPDEPGKPTKEFERSDGIWIAMGAVAGGLDGFRLTHQQARQAQVVAMATSREQRAWITDSEEAGLIALMCADLDAVRAWVGSVLGRLATDDEASARLRETAHSFLSSGGSYTAAAQELILHKNTVQYRIRKAEEIRGKPFADGRLDVEVALLLAQLLGSRVLNQPAATR